MRRILIFSLCIIATTHFAMAQEVRSNAPFEKAWASIDEALDKGLPQTAQTELAALQTSIDALPDSPLRTAHHLKALLYSHAISGQLTEGGDWASLRALDKQLSQTPAGMQASLLAVYLAERYHQYYQSNRWQIAQRTLVADVLPGDDETTWSTQHFLSRINELYLQALADEGLRNVAFATISPIIVSTTADNAVRPTVYDIVLDKALTYFDHNDAFVAEPQYETALDDPQLLADAPTFVQLQLPNTGRESASRQLLHIYQRALAYNLNTRPNSAAYIMLDLRRLQWVYNYLQHPNKHTAYLTALDNLLQKHQNTPLEAEVMMRVAQYHYDRGQNYEPITNADTLRWSWKKAVETAEELTKKHPDTPAGQDATALLAQLRQPYLTIQTEAVHLIKAPALVAVSYNNIAKLYFRVVAIDVDRYINQNREDADKTYAALTRLKALRSWDAALPQPGDFRIHNTETAFEGLPHGVYSLIVSASPNFEAKNGQYAYLYFWVSDLAALTFGAYWDSNRLMVVNRNNGQPVPGAEVSLWSYEYRWNENARRKRILSGTTDQNGQIPLIEEEQTQAQIEIRTKNDYLFTDDNVVVSSSRMAENDAQPMAIFFTDRGLYRPGQQVHFKLLAMQPSPTEVNVLVPNTAVTVVLMDANGQEVAQQELTTNSYGTAAGVFTLPTGGLLGQMGLVAKLGYGSYHSIRVEEYKRPRFEVKWNALEGSAQLGDDVTLQGSALGYSGPAVAEGQVVYTVTRAVHLPYWRRGFSPYYNQEQTIATGTTQTDADGNFEVQFQAQPDGALNNEALATYTFTVNADVTDATGETRSASKTIRLARYPYRFNAEIQRAVLSAPVTAVLSCTNLDDQPVTQPVQVRVTRMAAPEKTQITRYWEMPDQPVLKASNFRKQFPLLAFDKTELPEYWEEEKTVWTATVEVRGKDTLSIPAQYFTPGHYRLSMLQVTSSGDTLLAEAKITLHDWQQGKHPSGDWLYLQSAPDAAQPGQNWQIQLGQQSDAVLPYLVMSNRQNTLQDAWWQQPALQHTVQEADRGGLALHLAYVLHNRFYTINYSLPVAWDNKRLAISYETFRSQLYPGAEESWTLRITDKSGEAAPAELLAGMYDASLDQIQPFQWHFPDFPMHDGFAKVWQGRNFNALSATPPYSGDWADAAPGAREYPYLLFVPYTAGYYPGRGRMKMRAMALEADADGYANVEMAMASPPPPPSPQEGAVYESSSNTATENDAAPPAPVQVRTNLQETAFFLPQLLAEPDGSVKLTFRSPEALTRWKLQLFGHSRNLQYVLDSKDIVTQKELMVLPNAPRFVREGDKLVFTAKVSNLSDKTLSGNAVLTLFDPETNGELAAPFGLEALEASFTLAPKASQVLRWAIEVPSHAAGMMGYRVVARAGDYSDGEEAAIPVLTNRVLLTEARPLFVAGGKSATFTLDNLQNAPANTDHQLFRLDITSNPAWEAIKALPYLQEYPYDCTEQMVNRYYANALATAVVNRYPQTAQVFESWRRSEEGLKSPLLANQALKSALIEATPWLMDAKDETLQRQRIALLFDLDKMANEQAVTLKKLLDRQNPDGGFSWFPGGRGNWYMTQYVALQLSKVQQLANALPPDVQQALSKAIAYCDREAQRDYDERVKQKADLTQIPPSPLIANYLYLRSLTAEPIPAQYQKMLDYWWAQADKYWLQTNLHAHALLGMAAQQSNRSSLAGRIYASLRERALYSPELGRYWKYEQGWFWYQLPIETHVQLLNFFAMMKAPENELAELKIWLLRNKETNRWETTTATAAAIHALVNTGDDWLAESTPLRVGFPKMRENSYAQKLADAQANAEAGTGAYQVRWEAAEVQPNLATVRLSNEGKAPGWGALYWQYFQTIDQVQSATDNPLKVERQLLQKVNRGQGDELLPLDSAPQPGDRITVRLVIRTDRDMEFVHLKDLRASSLEPLDALSQYRWKSGLGYYQQTTDTGTHFFIDYLPKGEYVLEYDLSVFHTGDFSGGLATLQCMYAPKYTSLSQGQRFVVQKAD